MNVIFQKGLSEKNYFFRIRETMGFGGKNVKFQISAEVFQSNENSSDNLE